MEEIKKLEARDRQIMNDGRKPIPIKLFLLYSITSIGVVSILSMLTYSFVAMFLQFLQK